MKNGKVVAVENENGDNEEEVESVDDGASDGVEEAKDLRGGEVS